MKKKKKSIQTPQNIEKTQHCLELKYKILYQIKKLHIVDNLYNVSFSIYINIIVL